MRERLFKLLSNVFDVETKEINESLTKDSIYKWDSLVQMDLVTSIEKEFNIELSMEDILIMDSVRNIIMVLSKYGVFDEVAV